ncbi:MAG: ABC transporter ATP-binding protein [SAR324 cluster bacterium]|nr:ABC transporter ATP-binding protein [SAR324 cluster bacterium]
MSTLQIKGLCKSFGDVDALIEIDLMVRDGEFIVLVGPSGCGKSTLLRCIAGLEKHQAGDIVVDGKSITNVQTRDRNVAMVFQSYALFPHLTVTENIAFGLRLRRIDPGAIEEKVNYATEMLSLKELVDRYPRELSGGQRQRVAMGRAIVRDPMLFLFDEPLSNLDAKLRVQMRTEIKALRQRLGITSIYVTHDQDEAMTLADRIFILNNGRIEQTGTPMELYDEPANLFVAGFMGSPPMNFIELHRKGEGSHTQLETSGGQRVPLPQFDISSDMQTVVLGVRPEGFRIAENGPLRGEVEVVEPKGNETLVFVRLDESHLLCVVAGKRAVFQPNDSVSIAFDDSETHLFDSKTGLKITH